MYRRGNKNKIIMSLVLLLVLGISIGYATFTNTLRIDSGATVTPDSATFDIDFSTSDSGVAGSEITPVLTPTTLSATNAKIDNTSSPTLTNLSVDFKEPGQKAVYSFYVYNNGEYNAYLNSVSFLNATGADSFISCTAEEGTSYVEDACKGIIVTIQIGGLIITETKTDLMGQVLEPKTSEEVILTIEYNEVENRADGNVNVSFGDITLTYTTLDSNTLTLDNIADVSLWTSLGDNKYAYDVTLQPGTYHISGDFTLPSGRNGFVYWQVSNDGGTTYETYKYIIANTSVYEFDFTVTEGQKYRLWALNTSIAYIDAITIEKIS